jgi:hypothetical protein
LSQIQAKIETGSLYRCFPETWGEDQVKNSISTLMAATITLCIGIQSADASLLGMSLNLKAVAKLINLSGTCQFYTDDVLTGPLLASRC